MVFKTGNLIVQTGNGFFSPTSRPRFKTFFCKMFLNFTKEFKIDFQNSSLSATSHHLQCSTTCNALPVPPAMQHHLHCSTACNAAPHAMQHHLQCSTACNAAPHAMQHHLQCSTACNAAPQCKSEFATRVLQFGQQGLKRKVTLGFTQ